MKLILSEQEYNEAIRKAENRGYEQGLATQILDDRVKVVRCRNCIFYTEHETCDRLKKRTGENYYCATGMERK